MFRGFWLTLGTLLSSSFVYGAETTATTGGTVTWGLPIAVGLGIGLAVIGAATAQGRMAAAFMEGVSRNPGAQKSMFVPLIIALAFAETLVLFTFLVVSTLSGKF